MAKCIKGDVESFKVKLWIWSIVFMGDFDHEHVKTIRMKNLFNQCEPAQDAFYAENQQNGIFTSIC